MPGIRLPGRLLYSELQKKECSKHPGLPTTPRADTSARKHLKRSIVNSQNMP
jgi:hypothetical protein